MATSCFGCIDDLLSDCITIAEALNRSSRTINIAEAFHSDKKTDSLKYIILKHTDARIFELINNLASKILGDQSWKIFRFQNIEGASALTLSLNAHRCSIVELKEAYSQVISQIIKDLDFFRENINFFKISSSSDERELIVTLAQKFKLNDPLQRTA